MILQWIIREIVQRPLNALLLGISLTLAAGSIAGTVTMLRLFSLSTQHELEKKEGLLQQQMDEMWDDYRKITKGLGFNVLILPKEQNLQDFYAHDFASTYMPEAYAETLAQSEVITIQHILPTLVQKTIWPEKRRTIMVFGTRGELLRSHFPKANKKAPILSAVKPGTIVLGHDIWHTEGIEAGDKISIRGKAFEVVTCHPARGTRDDIAVWIDLDEAQEMFRKENEINAILALECRCKADENLPNLAKIRTSLEKTLPNTQVIEYLSEVIARAEARYAASSISEESVDAEREHGNAMVQKGRDLAGWVIPIIVTLCGIAAGLLVMLNTRERRLEIGIMRSIGIRSHQIGIILLGRLAFLGMLAGFAGYAIDIGIQAYAISKIFQLGYDTFTPNISFGVLLLVVTPLTAVIAGWLPVFSGLQNDPANILREEK